jgi:hypothetical protein
MQAAIVVCAHMVRWERVHHGESDNDPALFQ